MKADKLLKGLQKALQSPFLLAIVPALLLLYFLPLRIEKYKAAITSVEKAGQNQSIYMTLYADFDNDQLKEKFVIGSRQDLDSSLFFARITSRGWTYKEEWVFRQQPVLFSNPAIFDTDHNGIAEVYFFTRKEDSLFVNRLEPYGKPEMALRSFFIDHISADRNTFDIKLTPLDFSDHDNDGLAELNFVAVCGYCRQPRRVYRFHPSRGVVETSVEVGIGFDNASSCMIAVDLDGDSKNEYLLGNSDFKNFSEVLDKTKLPFLDTCAYVVAMDDDLEFLFEPIPIRSSVFKPAILDKDGKTFFYYCEKGASYFQNYLIIRNNKGKLVGSFPVIQTPEIILTVSDFWKIRNDLLAVTDRQSIYIYNFKGKLVHRISLEGHSYFYSQGLNLIDDGNTKLILMGGNHLEIIDQLKHHAVTVILDEVMSFPIYISVIENNATQALFTVNNKFISCEISYQYNPIYPWRWLLWAAVYLAVVLLLWVVQYLQRKQLNQKYETERALTAFRFRALKNQVDPHFTLNALNSIAYMQEHGQQEKAGRFLVKFSRMIHRTLESSDKIETTLEDELAFVRDYLDVQQMRFREAFAYNISIDDEKLYDLAVPRHLVHTFVENALKHGIRPLDKGGIISIAVQRKDQHVHISISDNGVGRTEAAKYKKLSTGKGLKIIDELIELFEKLKKVKISYAIIDKFAPDGQAAGTLVTINIPWTDDSKQA